MTTPRTSGILLHPSSLPGRWGIGDLGEAAYRFVDFLVEADQQLWQVMPLGPTGYGDSPYQSFSASAGNPLLISPELLHQAGLLTDDDLPGMPAFPNDAVDYGTVIPYKLELLRRSFARFQANASSEQRQALSAFRAYNYAWLDDYALFAALKSTHNGASWHTWQPEIARRDPTAISRCMSELTEEVQFHAYMQFQFFEQWGQLRRYANERGIRIIGDMPIFVAFDSADLWANSEIFALDTDYTPTVVAGVPPDYFSATGQLWGNPLYRWDVLEERGYDWWIERFRSMFTLFDLVRLDHFRGFAAYWEVPAGEETAINGRWVAGPGAPLFRAVQSTFGELPLIAEDLGLITPDVEELRQGLGMPGMKVLQFAFGTGPDAPYLPHNYERASVVYTGTHDNDTTRGWWQTLDAEARSHATAYLGSDGSTITWDLIRLALASVADTAIVPMQDVLDLDSAARMNTPGRAGGNWTWRLAGDTLSEPLAARLRTLTQLYGRGRVLPQTIKAASRSADEPDAS